MGEKTTMIENLKNEEKVISKEWIENILSSVITYHAVDYFDKQGSTYEELIGEASSALYKAISKINKDEKENLVSDKKDLREKLIDTILKVAMQHHDDLSKSDEDAACDAADEIIETFPRILPPKPGHDVDKFYKE